ncbi:hypothetical protein EVAR_38260_1 [Eumeta japonica]|uniref:Uncharacterized protein n=1 Tax=Eumeta variegata TaxID=151549 RepID=A0A4C1YBQ5_EUMVA|nr:hypothetical protein EVAR_38260_1 [Eumeta japonica]
MIRLTSENYGVIFTKKSYGAFAPWISTAGLKPRFIKADFEKLQVDMIETPVPISAEKKKDLSAVLPHLAGDRKLLFFVITYFRRRHGRFDHLVVGAADRALSAPPTERRQRRRQSAVSAADRALSAPPSEHYQHHCVKTNTNPGANDFMPFVIEN